MCAASAAPAAGLLANQHNGAKIMKRKNNPKPQKTENPVDLETLQLDSVLDNAFEDSAFQLSPDILRANDARRIVEDFEGLCDGVES